ncbi:LANO_0G01574g1_1 [Lachancea nothofagi CBS 11611]|uniref:LANO_0G01574g1_1 n=1 Tax=Lachancea nothofagi CBS 11611 TaxID=1266666 RepID=A0A1G4KEN1_9SACH|nr:LANO_0G01574g1_1 [Lachancea nothofagi CBS 11611]
MATSRVPTIKQLAAYTTDFGSLYATCAVTVGAFVSSELFLHPRLSKQFRTDDLAINKSYVPNETITNLQCLLIAFPLPMLVLSWWCLVGSDTLVQNRFLARSHVGVAKPDWLAAKYHLYHASCVALVLVLGFNGLLTNALKLLISNARPDFIARCKPEDSSAPYVSAAQCTQEDKFILYEGLKSTPSGHSSFAAAGLGFLYMWQVRHTRVSRLRHIWCPVLCLLVMVSRVVDHRHHWYDVISGCLLGMGVCALVWRSLMREDVPTLLPL